MNFFSLNSNARQAMLAGAIIIAVATVFDLGTIFQGHGLSDENSAVEIAEQPYQAVLGEKVAATPEFTQAVAASENFKLSQVNLGDTGVQVFDFTDNGIFRVGGVKSELYFSKEADANETRAIISSQTNRLSYVQVEYYKSGEKIKKTAGDSYLGRSHVVTLPALEADAVYKFMVIAEDTNGNKISSNQYVLYTGAANISLVDILGDAAQKVFGWAIKK